MSRDKVSRLVNWGHWYAFINGLFAIVIGLRYLDTVGYPESWLGWGYLAINTIGQFSFLAFIVYLVILFPVTLILPYSKILRGLAAIIATLGLCVLLYDTIVYDDYGLHLSPFSFDLAWADLNALLHGSSYVITPLVIIAVELTLANFLWKRIDKIQKRNLGAKVVACVGICFVSSHLIHIWADASEFGEITRFDDTYPLSYPATARSFLESHGIESSKSAPPVRTSHRFDYPQTPLQCQIETQRNILIIAIDGFRSDMTDKATMPFFNDYMAENQSFKQHYSGGNQSHSGMFSLLYGIQGSYIDLMDNRALKPVLSQEFTKQGYELGLFAGAPANDADVNRYMFNDFDIHYSPITDGRAQADITSVDNFKRWQAYRSQPWLAMVNLGSPEDYDTPTGFLGIETVQAKNKLVPAQKVLFNQYRQSLHFIDHQLEHILTQVPEDTLIIITGVSGKVFSSDHHKAQADLSPANVRVPLVIHWPNGQHKSVQHRTSHYGVVPTLMTHALGCVNPAADYSAGRSLLTPDNETWIYVSAQRRFAIYQKEEITVIDRDGKYRIYDKDYNKRLRKKLSSPELIEVMREGRRFYQQ